LQSAVRDSNRDSARPRAAIDGATVV